MEHLQDAVSMEYMLAAEGYAWFLSESAGVADAAEFILLCIDQRKAEEATSWTIELICVSSILLTLCIEADNALTLALDSFALVAALQCTLTWMERRILFLLFLLFFKLYVKSLDCFLI